jgi:hypothetical protein
MANLKDNNYHNLKIRVNKDEYWDFFINKDSYGYFYSSPNSMYDKCLISYIDSSLPECYSGNTWLFSTNDYQWESAYTVSNTLNNIGYTGVDNGLIQFRKDRISNKDFIDIYSNSKYEIEEGDNRLKLHAVSGNTLLYEYPLHVEDGIIKLNGGFYQGFFMTECDKYRVLPSRMENGDTWELEFELNKCELEKESDKTLNDKYPNNKGIFFYLGTRAENKWIYLYEDDDECFALSYDDYIEDAHVDKKDYIIGNFYDLDPEFVETPPLDVDNYLNFNYYDDSYYTVSEEELMDGYVECDGHSILDDYLDYDITPRTIDEDLPHITMDSWCCNIEEKKKTKAKQVSFFTACGCIKQAYVKVEDADDTKLAGCDLFGEGDYIDDFDGLDYDTDYWEPEMDISDFEYDTDNGFKLPSANDYYFYTDNKFLLFDRTPKGYTTRDWVEGTQMMYFGKKNKFKGNLFILMNRTSTGYTVKDIDKLRDEANNKYDDTYNDIYNNAFALRITDDGEIGFRYLILDCESENEHKYSVIEGYSFPGVISDCVWHTVHVKIKNFFGNIKLYFYVDGKLVYVTRELPNFNFHKLNDLNEKQEGVPYNISLGGGTQGLAETILPNYMLEPSRVYPLEENFAGTFIGYMRSFKFYNCGMEYMNILNNYKFIKNNRNSF